MAKGGARPGAGRKKGEKAKLAELYNIELAKQVEKEKKPIIEALVNKAKDGDIPAIKEIHERLMGKVSQPLGNDPENPLVLPIYGGLSRHNSDQKDIQPKQEN